jgi:basic membrane protein A
MIKRGDVAVFDTIRDVTQGEFKAGLRSFGVADEGIGYVRSGPHAEGIPEAAKARIDALKGRIASGEIKVPTP